jgi:hypothetical protein
MVEIERGFESKKIVQEIAISMIKILYSTSNIML